MFRCTLLTVEAIIYGHDLIYDSHTNLHPVKSIFSCLYDLLCPGYNLGARTARLTPSPPPPLPPCTDRQLLV
jgi:hypothetical protein